LQIQNKNPPIKQKKDGTNSFPPLFPTKNSFIAEKELFVKA
jgi:hypothetical protein